MPRADQGDEIEFDGVHRFGEQPTIIPPVRFQNRTGQGSDGLAEFDRLFVEWPIHWPFEHQCADRRAKRFQRD